MHEPVEQEACDPQELPQNPQWEELVRRLVSQPFDHEASQLPYPVMHMQSPPEQVALALHRLPQEPQLSAWV